MEQHPDTIALEMITDAEAEPFLALSDVESHRRSAEYKGHKKQLEDEMKNIIKKIYKDMMRTCYEAKNDIPYGNGMGF